MNVLWATLILTGLGLACGALLALASKYFGISEDERVINVRSHLPGANCGACGYSGCDAYAKAVVNGEKSNLCIPGGDKCAAEIAETLNIEALDVIEMVALVNCGGNCNVTERISDANGVSTCSARALIWGGNGSCKYGCLGCGDCAEACPTGAICVKDGVAVVDASKCIGCGLCARQCPKNIISMVPLTAKVGVVCSSRDKGADTRKVCKVGCIGCGKCEKNCKYDAIKVLDNFAKIDYNKCADCGECAEVCPVGCIRYLGGSEKPYADAIEK